MVDQPDLATVARDIIDANLYMVLGTADAAGQPWASPVYYAHAGYRTFFRVSKPGARHSRNLDARPDVSIVIFDSSVPINTGQAVYMSGVAKEIHGEERNQPIEIFSRRTRSHDGCDWTLADVEGKARLRLYQATPHEHFVLDDHDIRVPVAV